MPVVSGIDGDVTFASGWDVKVTSWTINFTSEDVDTTELGDTWGKRIAGLKRWSGTYNALIDHTLSGIDASGTSDTLNLGGSAATAVFQYRNYGGTDGTISGQIIITGVDMNMAVEGGAGNYTFTFGGHGTPTLNKAGG